MSCPKITKIFEKKKKKDKPPVDFRSTQLPVLLWPSFRLTRTKGVSSTPPPPLSPIHTHTHRVRDVKSAEIFSNLDLDLALAILNIYRKCPVV